MKPGPNREATVDAVPRAPEPVAAPFERPEWHAGTPRLWRRILRTILIDACIAVGLLTLGEVAARVIFGPAAYFVFTEDRTGGHPVQSNSMGLRDVEFPLDKPADVRRIVCLGNSTTWGFGEAMAAAWPKQLEAVLRERHPDEHWQVINAAAQGGDLARGREYLRTHAERLRPELVIYGFSASLLSAQPRKEAAAAPAGQSPLAGWRQWAKRAPLWVHNQLHEHSRLYAAADFGLRRNLFRLGVIREGLDKRWGAIFAYAFDVPGVDEAEVRRAYEFVGREFAELKGELDPRGIKLLAVGLPASIDISDSPLDNERGIDKDLARIRPMDEFAAIAAATQTPFVDGRVRLARERAEMLGGGKPWRDLYIPSDYVHLDRDGLRMIAEELAARLEALGWVGGR